MEKWERVTRGTNVSAWLPHEIILILVFLMQMEKINTIIIQCANVKCAGVAGTIDGHTLKTSPVLKGLTKAAKGGNYSWSSLGQVGKGQDDKEKGGE